MSNSILADNFLDHHFPGTWAREPITGTTVYNIDSDHMPELRDALVDFIAHVVAGILDAGSERDAVNENVDLHNAIEDELKGWTA